MTPERHLLPLAVGFAKSDENHTSTRLRSSQICVELLVRLHPSTGVKCGSYSTVDFISAHFGNFHAKRIFLAKISPKCPKPPKTEIPRNPPKFPEIPRNPPKISNFRMVCALRRNYEYWVRTWTLCGWLSNDLLLASWDDNWDMKRLECANLVKPWEHCQTLVFKILMKRQCLPTSDGHVGKLLVSAAKNSRAEGAVKGKTAKFAKGSFGKGVFSEKSIFSRF